MCIFTFCEFLLNFARAEIGIMLVACNIPPFVDLVALFLNIWNFYIVWQIWANPIIAVGFCVLTISGLVLYVIWRKEFLGRVKGSKFASVVLLTISLILIVGGILQSIFTVLSVNYYTARTSGWHPLTLEEMTIYTLYFVWSGVAFTSGVLWLFDRVRIGEDKALLLEKGIGLESQTKYPKELFAKYVKQYSHNPAGVLEWHIDKKVKEGKTREQVIEELKEA